MWWTTTSSRCLEVFVNWKSRIKGKGKALKMKRSNTTDKCNEKLSNLEVRLLRIMDKRSNSVQATLRDSIIIENNDRIEFVNEDGTIISNTEELEFICDGPMLPKIKQTPKGTPLSIQQDDYRTPDSGFLEASPQNSEVGSSFNGEMLIELKGIKNTLDMQLKEMRVQNKINKLRARIEYERAKAKYENFNIEIKF